MDLATHPNAKEELKKRMPVEMANPPILPPQIFCNNVYLGDYDAFFMAKEMELSLTFFHQEIDTLENFHVVISCESQLVTSFL